jgi:hypothetical protein
MANVTLLIANPTTADVTVNAQVAKKGTVTELVIDNTTTDAYGFLAAKCSIVSKSAQSDLSARTGAAFLLERLQHRQ